AYVASLGLIIIALKLLQNIKLTQLKMITLATAAVCFLFTVYHITDYKDEGTFYGRAVATSPTHTTSQSSLGAYYVRNGDLEKAKIIFDKAAQMDPNTEKLNNNIGVMYLHLNEFQKAEQYFLKEIKLYPGYFLAWDNLGIAQYHQGRTDDA